MGCALRIRMQKGPQLTVSSPIYVWNYPTLKLSHSPTTVIGFQKHLPTIREESQALEESIHRISSSPRHIHLHNI